MDAIEFILKRTVTDAEVNAFNAANGANLKLNEARGFVEFIAQQILDNERVYREIRTDLEASYNGLLELQAKAIRHYPDRPVTKAVQRAIYALKKGAEWLTDPGFPDPETETRKPVGEPKA